MRTLEKRLKNIIHNYITPRLNGLYFVNNKYVFCKKNDELIYLIDVQKSKSSNRLELQFTLNCGIYIRGVVSKYLGVPDLPNILIEHRCLSARVGMLMPDHLDIWWKLSDDDSDVVDNVIGIDVIYKIETYIIPFLSMFINQISVAEFLSSSTDIKYKFISPGHKSQRMAYSAIIYKNNGYIDIYSKLIDSAIAFSAKSPIEETLIELKQRLQDGPD